MAFDAAPWFSFLEDQVLIFGPVVPSSPPLLHCPIVKSGISGGI